MKIEIVIMVVVFAVLVCGCGLLMLPRCPPCTGNRNGNERFSVGAPFFCTESDKSPRSSWRCAKKVVHPGESRCQRCGKDKDLKYCTDFHKSLSVYENGYTHSYRLCSNCYNEAWKQRKNTLMTKGGPCEDVVPEGTEPVRLPY